MHDRRIQMLDDFYPSDEYETDGWEAGLTFSQPNDVVRDPSLTTAQKRAILASWASDARAVADAPSRRQLDDGTMLDIDDILDALKQLDREQGAVRTSPLKVKSRLRHRRAFRGALRYWGTFRRDDGDDDDPPPCPAAARVPRLTPSLSGGAAVAAA
jgi:hypothetical protein